MLRSGIALRSVVQDNSRHSLLKNVSKLVGWSPSNEFWGKCGFEEIRQYMA